MYFSKLFVLVVILLPTVVHSKLRIRTGVGRAVSTAVRTASRANHYDSNNNFNPNYNSWASTNQNGYNMFQPSWSTRLAERFRTSAVLDVAIICDKDFSNLFQQNRTKILEYWTHRFHEVNMQFMTLRKMKISFRVTKVTLISKVSEQIYVLMALNHTTGLTDPDQLFSGFSKHMYINSYAERNKVDIYFLATNATGLEWHGFVGLVGSLCVSDNMGDFYFKGGLVSSRRASQQLGSLVPLLAALVGAEDDNHAKDCHSLGHIMDLGIFKLFLNQTFPTFSECSDLLISEYFKSGNASCLPHNGRRDVSLVLDPDYDDVLPATFTEQCIAVRNDSSGYVRFPQGMNKCRSVACGVKSDDETYLFTPNENTNCGDGKRCFLGECLEPGLLLVNVGSGSCLLSRDRFKNADIPSLLPCPRSSTPFDRFQVKSYNSTNDEVVKLATPFIIPDPYLRDEKCLSVNATDENSMDMRFSPCNDDSTSAWQEWKQIPVGDNEFLLQHQSTQRCLGLKQQLRSNFALIALNKLCDMEDPSFRWKFHRIYSEVGMCANADADDDCTADLTILASFRNNVAEEGYNVSDGWNYNHTVILDISLENQGEPAIAPAVVVAWTMKLKLTKTPHNCFSFSGTINNPQKLKCKLGRLLNGNETAALVSLELDMKPYNDGLTKGLSKNLDFDLTAVTASRLLRGVNIKTEQVAVNGFKPVIETFTASNTGSSYGNYYGKSQDTSYNGDYTTTTSTGTIIIPIGLIIALIGAACRICRAFKNDENDGQAKTPQDNGGGEDN